MATLRALECLVALADAGSVTGAAAALHMSQPALSHQIAALEKELGTPVVHRLARGVRVTAAGLAAVEEARIALDAADRAVRIGRKVGAGAGGRLRIACAETMTTWLLVPVLRHWRAHRSAVALELTEQTSADRMAELISTGAADLAVGPRPSTTDEHVVVLGHEDVVLVAPAGHPFADRPEVPFTELTGEPFVHYTPDNEPSVWVDQLVAQHQVRLDPVLRIRSPRTAAQLRRPGWASRSSRYRRCRPGRPDSSGRSRLGSPGKWWRWSRRRRTHWRRGSYRTCAGAACPKANRCWEGRVGRASCCAAVVGAVDDRRRDSVRNSVVEGDLPALVVHGPMMPVAEQDQILQ